jgi:hypothetical protein
MHINLVVLLIGIALMAFGGALFASSHGSFGHGTLGVTLLFLSLIPLALGLFSSPPVHAPRHLAVQEAQALAKAATSLAGPGDPGGAPADIPVAVHGYNQWTHDNLSVFVTASLIATKYPTREVQYVVGNSYNNQVACLSFAWASDTWSVKRGWCHS